MVIDVDVELSITPHPLAKNWHCQNELAGAEGFEPPHGGIKTRSRI